MDVERDVYSVNVKKLCEPTTDLTTMEKDSGRGGGVGLI